jgi:lipooligosaccharide transport system permease protein
MLYLLGLGIGVGTLVNSNAESGDALGGLSYAQFVAPGLLVSTAMTVAFVESTWPVLGGFKWQRYYHAMAATPLRPLDIVGGHLVWITLRIFVATGVVAVAMMAFPSVRSVWLLPSVVFATFAGLAFSMVWYAFAAHQEREVAFVSLNRFVVVPLTLFGGVFFPITQLPSWLQGIVKVTPLWHGAELSRSLIQRSFEWPTALARLAYLSVWIVAGTVVASQQFRIRLGR